MQQTPLPVLALALALALPLGVVATADAGCDFEHPRKAKIFRTDFVQAFISCGNPGGNTPNTTSASGVPGCRLTETFNQQDGTPVNGWQWDEARSTGDLLIRETQCPFPGANCRDLKMKLRLRNIIDGTGAPANGNGTLFLQTRATLEDTVVTAPGMGTDMTIIDFPAPFVIAMQDGKGTLATGGMLLLGLGTDPLPGCTSIEIVSLAIFDPNGNPFARPGIFFKDLPN